MGGDNIYRVLVVIPPGLPRFVEPKIGICLRGKRAAGCAGTDDPWDCGSMCVLWGQWEN